MFKFRKHENKEAIGESYCSFSWSVKERTADFDKIFKFIEKHNLKVFDLRFYNGCVCYGSDDRHCLSIGLRGTYKNMLAFMDECYENKELDFFNP